MKQFNNKTAQLGCWLPDCQPGSSLVRARIRGLADIEQIEHFNPQDLLLADTTYEYLKKVTALFADKTAIRVMNSANPVDGCTEVSYTEYLKGVTASANLFYEAGGDRSVVALMTPILLESLYAAWGATTAGVLSPINPFLEPDLVIGILNTIKATTLVTTVAYGPSAADHLEYIVNQTPSLKKVWLIDSKESSNDFALALSNQNSDELNFTPDQDGGSECIYLPTGGTTGSPKLARLNHRAKLLNAWIAGTEMGAAEDEVVGVGMPLFHVGGLLMLSLRALVLGQTALLLTPGGFRNPGIVEHFWEISRRFGMTSLIATPTSAAAILNQNVAHQGNNIRILTCGGSAVPVELGKAFNRKFGVQIREVWGATEFHGLLSSTPAEVEPQYGSVGIRVPFHQVKPFIVNENNQFIREASINEPGVVCASGPCLTCGYLSEENNKEFFVDNTSSTEVWGNSGDLGYIDTNGYIWLTGRKKDLIIRGGHNIDPRMIEEVLVTHPAVQLVAAIGYPDASKGELPVAYVQLIAGQHVEVEELISFCRERIAERAAVPVKIFITTTMPLTAVGKIFKPELRHRATRDLVRNTAAEISEEFAASIKIDIQNIESKTRVCIQKTGDKGEVDCFKQLLERLKYYDFSVHLEN